MTHFVRRNLIVIKGIFRARDGSAAAPSSAVATLSYTGINGGNVVDTVTLTLQADGVTWQGSWDSSNAAVGDVYWFVRAYGGLQAAEEGVFQITANAANLVS